MQAYHSASTLAHKVFLHTSHLNEKYSTFDVMNTRTTTTSTPSSLSSVSSLSSTSPSPSPSANSHTYHFKILVPAAAAGRIIGKGGTTIAQLQKDAGARVKMSKASEFYPGTTERVCLISGPIEGILKINDFFMENFSSSSLKILVPNSTAGMIIGKGGSYIKQIKEESGAYVQISQKCADISLPERCVTIVGEIDNIRKACTMILTKIVEDVGSAYRDTRASSLTTTVPNVHTTIDTIQTETTSSDVQIIESIKLVLTVCGYGEDAVSEITSAMSVLASYGVLGIGLGL